MSATALHPHELNDDQALRKHLPGALRAVQKIFDSWQLTDQQARTVLGVPRSTYDRWKKRPESARFSRDLMERLSYILGIRKALEILLPNERARIVESSWLHRPNHEVLFGHKPPLNRLLSGRVADLYETRRYLDGQRGW